ncbi:MAG: hypothetical protein Ct9H300mP18_11720 [Candidatus Neomarinimicrobiota bacterium]|nr:MAG: hypothetical protein Ct9H300mP18_11720 [Candidatus Neomarinimicrobiota bacterium]
MSWCLYPQYFIIQGAKLSENFIYTYALIPANPTILTIFSSMFMHGGFTHIIFNMGFFYGYLAKY